MTPLPERAYDSHYSSVESLNLGLPIPRQEQPWTGQKVVQSKADAKTKTKVVWSLL